MSGALKKRGAPPPPPGSPAALSPPVTSHEDREDDENANVRKASVASSLDIHGIRHSVSMPLHAENGLASRDSSSMTSLETNDSAPEVTFVLVLPDGTKSTVTVSQNIQLMDLLVQVAASNKLSPVGHSLVPFDKDGHEVQYKPSQTVGVIMPSEIRLEKKNKKPDLAALKRESITKIPFEMTHRLTVNLPHKQKMVMRVNIETKLSEIFAIICSEKNIDSFEHELRHPKKLNEELNLDLTLAQYGLSEIKVVDIRAPYSRRGSDELSSASMPNLTQVGTDKHRKKRGLFGFLRKDKNKDKKQRRTMMCFDQAADSPPSPVSTIPRRSLYTDLAVVPEATSTNLTSPPIGQQPSNHSASTPVSPAHSAKKRPAPPPPASISRGSSDICSAEHGPVHQASLGIPLEVTSAPNLTHSRRASAMSGVSDSMDFRYGTTSPVTSQTATSPSDTMGRKKRQAPAPPNMESSKQSSPEGPESSKHAPPEDIQSSKHAPPEDTQSSKHAPPEDAESSKHAPLEDVQLSKHAPPEDAQSLEIPMSREASTNTPDVEEERLENSSDESDEDVPEIPVYNVSATADYITRQTETEMASQTDEPVISKTPPKKPPRPGGSLSAETEIDIAPCTLSVTSCSDRGPCLFVAPPPPVEPPPPQDDSGDTNGWMVHRSVTAHISPLPSLSSDTELSLRGSETSETLYDVTNAFDDVILEAEKAMNNECEVFTAVSDRITPSPVADVVRDGESSSPSMCASTLDVDRELTPPIDYDDVIIPPPGVFSSSAADDTSPIEVVPNTDMYDVTMNRITDGENIGVDISHDIKGDPIEIPEADFTVSAEPRHSINNETKTDDDVIDVDDVLTRFDHVTSEANHMISEVEMNFEIDSPRSDRMGSPVSENIEIFDVEIKKSHPELMSSAVVDVKPVDDVTNQTVIVLNKSDDVVDFDTVKKRTREAREKRQSKLKQPNYGKPQLVLDYVDSAAQNTVTFKPSTEHEQQNVLEVKSLMLMKRHTIAKSIKLDAVELNKTKNKTLITADIASKTETTAKVIKPEVASKIVEPEAEVLETTSLTMKPEAKVIPQPPKYRYKEVSVRPKVATKKVWPPPKSDVKMADQTDSGDSGDRQLPSTDDKRAQKLEVKVKVLEKQSSSESSSSVDGEHAVSKIPKMRPVTMRSVTSANVTKRPVTMHVASDGSAAFGFVPIVKPDIPNSLDKSSKEELKGKLSELHSQFGEIQRKFQQNQTLLAQQKVNQGLAKLEGTPTLPRAPTIVPSTSLPQPTPVNAPAPNGRSTPPPSMGGTIPPPPPIGFSAMKSSTNQKPTTSEFESKRSNRPVISQSEPRDDLMAAIRNKGGRSGLRKVAVEETNWAMSVS